MRISSDHSDEFVAWDSHLEMTLSRTSSSSSSIRPVHVPARTCLAISVSPSMSLILAPLRFNVFSPFETSRWTPLIWVKRDPLRSKRSKRGMISARHSKRSSVDSRELLTMLSSCSCAKQLSPRGNRSDVRGRTSITTSLWIVQPSGTALAQFRRSNSRFGLSKSFPFILSIDISR